MAQSYKWTRRKLSAQEYNILMGISKSTPDEKKDSETNQHGKAYEVASDIRKFEIDKYWQRTLYFWGFISAIYVAYYSVLKDFYADKCGNQEHGGLPLLILSMLGLFFCFSWLLASKGSKHWQENWENHIDMLEDAVTGPLYKTYLAESSDSFSVSKINIMAGRVLSICAYGLVAFEIINFVENTLELSGATAIVISLLLIVCTGLSLLVYANHVKGNAKSNGSIEFDIKEYGDSNE